MSEIRHEDISEFLEHYGVPGMKWGVRKDRSSSATKTEDKERSARRKKVIKTVATATVMAGASFVAYNLAKSNRGPGPQKMADLSKTSINDGYKAVNSLLRQQDIERVRLDQAKRSREVNRELRRWYNEGNRPVPQRWYMGDE